METNAQALQSKKNSRWRDLWPILGLLALTLLFQPSIAFFAELPLDSDTLLFFYPLRALHSDPHVGLWNPYQFCGMPRDANPQSQLLYPPNILFTIAPPHVGYAAMLIGHLWLGAALMYALMRSLKLDICSAFFGAAVFLASTFWQCKITNLGLLEGIAWQPGALLFALKSFERHTVRNALLASFFLAMTITCGVPHTVIYAGVMLCLLALGHLVYQPTRWSAIALSLGLTFGFAVMMTMGVWLPSALYSVETQRVQLDLQDALAGSLGWSEIWRVFLGGLSQPQISRHEPWEGTCFIGPTALALIPLGLWRMPKSLRSGLILTFLFAWFCSLGSSGLLFPFLHSYIPGWSFLNLPNRSLLMAAIALPMFAAFGFDFLRRWKPESAGIRHAPIAVIFICVGVFLSFPYNSGLSPFSAVSNPSYTSQFGPGAFSNDFVLLFTFLFWINLLSVVLILYWKHYFHPAILTLIFVIFTCAQFLMYSPRLFLETTPHNWMDQPNTIAYVKKQLNENPNLRVVGHAPFLDSDDDVRSDWTRYLDMHRLPDVNRIHEVQGYDPMYPKRYGELIEALSGKKQNSDLTRKIRLNELSKPMLDMLNVGYVIGHPDQSLLYAGNVMLDKPGEISAALQKPLEVEEIAVRWLMDNTAHYPQGTHVGNIRLAFEGESVGETLPIQAGIHIANPILKFGRNYIKHRAAPIFRWFPIPSKDGYQRIHQYLYTYQLPSPATIDQIAIEQIQSGFTPNPLMVIQQITLHTSDHKGLEKMDSGAELPIFRNPDARKTSAYLASSAIFYETLEGMKQSLNQLKANEPLPVFFSKIPNPAVVDPMPENGRHAFPNRANPLGEIESIERAHSDRFDIRLNVNDNFCLVIPENFSRHWRIKGLSYTRPHLANHAFMAMPVDPNWSSFSLVYVPIPYYFGCAAGGVFVLIAIGLCHYLWTREKQNGKNEIGHQEISAIQ